MSNNEKPITMNEHLSAMLDDESGSFERHRILDDLKRDQSLVKKLSNYALISETMRLGETETTVPLANQSFLTSIHEKISSEDQFNQVIIETGSTSSNSSWLRPIGGFAIAASFGALALMGIQNIGLLNNQSTPTKTIADENSQIAIAHTNTQQTHSLNENNNEVEKSNVVVKSPTFDESYVDADARTRTMLKRYVDSHMQYATASAFVPSVRVIAYTDNQ